MQARTHAMDLAREEIALYLKGFDPASDVSNEVLPKVYLSDSVEWQRDDESLQFCVLASMNYQDLQAAENKFGRNVDTAEIEERFTTLSLLSEKGQEREMLADMQEIAVLEKKRQGWIDENTALKNIELKNISLGEGKYGTAKIAGTVINRSSIGFAVADITLSIFTDSRPYPIASESAVELRPLGGVMPGEEVTFNEEVSLGDLIDVIDRLGSQDYRFEATVETLYGPGGYANIIARGWDLEALSTGASMRRLQSLKAKWSLAQ